MRRSVLRPYTSPTENSGANDAAHQRPFFFWRVVADHVTVADESSCFGKFRVAIVMNGDQLFVSFHAVADALVEFQPHGMIDLVLFFLAPSTEHGKSRPELLALCGNNKACLRTNDLNVGARLRQALRFVHHSLIPALQAYPLPQF